MANFRVRSRQILVFWTGWLLISSTYAGQSELTPEFMPCSPMSESALFLTEDLTVSPSLHFCADWNPEFSGNGHRCCSRRFKNRRRLSRSLCSPHRRKSSYCDEMTESQREYREAASSGKLGDALETITSEIGRKGDQAYCTVGNGFLAWGRMLIPSRQNRIRLNAPQRCTEFGTDPMVAMLEWVGREVAQEYADPEYAGVRLLVGDISAPRGGCLSGRSGRRGHASHTTGQDADVGFLAARENTESPSRFHRKFDAAENWDLIKRIFRNPFACIKVIFLDRKHIAKLAKAARNDEDWIKFRRFIRHMPGHKNHFHIRIGEGAGQAGCVPNPRPELETEGDVDLSDILSPAPPGSKNP